MLDLWWTELRQVKAHLRALFPHPSVASAAAFLDGLLGPERRKTGWMRAEAAGDPGPWRPQAVLGRSHGTQTPCATWCARTQSRRLLLRMRGSSSTRPAFSSRARARVGVDGHTPDRRA